MKKIMAVLLFLSVLCTLFASCKDKPEKNGASSDLVKDVATAQNSFKGNVLTKQLLLQAVEVSDGYLMANNAIEKYDKSGNPVWNKTYPFFSNSDAYAAIVIQPLLDGAFAFSYDVATYQNPDGSWTITDTVLAKCDADGNLLWHHAFEGFTDTVVERIFELTSGNIATVGNAYEQDNPEEREADDIYLSLFSPKGKLIKTQKYGGSDFDFLWGADYISDVGLIAHFNTQSKDGTFSSSTDGYGVDVLALIDDELNIKWHKALKQWISLDSLLATDRAIYLLDTQNKYCKIDFYGNILFDQSIAEKSISTHFVGNTSRGQVVQVDDQLVFYDDLTAKQTIHFAGGEAAKIIESDDGFVIVSTKVTGQLPSPPVLSSLWYSSEIVYSGYDRSGKLLWRDAHDITPQAWYDYDPDEIE